MELTCVCRISTTLFIIVVIVTRTPLKSTTFVIGYGGIENGVEAG